MSQSPLHKLGYTVARGLVHNLYEAKNNMERLYIEDGKRFCVPPSAIFFKRSYKNDTDQIPNDSIPVVYIFKQKDSFFNTPKSQTLHAELWSSGNAEVYIILGETLIKFIDTRKPAKREGNGVNLEELELYSGYIEEFNDARFHAHLFASGTFWAQSDFQDKIDSNSNPYNFLLSYLNIVRQKLQKNDSIKLAPTTIDKLLITSILIKFLEEVKDDDGKHTLRDIYKKYNLQTETFEESLRNGKCLSVLEDLSKVFNGKVFDTFTDEEKRQITNTNLSLIAAFLGADVDVKTSQLFIWKQYSFKHLPAEVISAIYENFIQGDEEIKRKDVVYTPLHLANLIIDEVMPLEQPELFENQSFKILDPACGSGIFLVAAYKRMLQWWAINHFQKTKEIAYPNKEVAKQILERNIFGVDVEEVAALISIFGLTTAFLDRLTPKEVWNDLTFQNLSDKNICGGQNFIHWAKDAKANNLHFDLVIGNPPFNDSPKGEITTEEFKTLFGKKVPNNKLALKFLDAALFFGKRVGMVIPSNAFLYNKDKNAHEYRKDIFTHCTVEKIYDFTHLRRVLFNRVDIPVLALIIQKKPSEYQSIEHIVVKREFQSEQQVRFEIDYYDKHQVRWDWAIDAQKHFVWKTNLLGGGRLFHLIYRLSLLKTLNSFLQEKIQEEAWEYNNGYITGGDKSDKKPADFLSGHLEIKPKTFDEFGKFETQTIPDDARFLNPRTSALFKNPHIVLQLVSKTSKISAAFIETHICFNSSFVGISAPNKCKNELYKIYERLNQNVKISNVYRTYILVNSPKALIYRETSIIKNDIDVLPYPVEDEYLETSESEEIIINDVLNYYIHLAKSPQKGGSMLYAPITKKTASDLVKFGETYCEVLNEIYAENGSSWQIGTVCCSPDFICYQFGFGKNDELQKSVEFVDSEENLNVLFNDLQSNSGIRYQKIIRYYDHKDGFDCVYLIKPNTKKYWLPSIALRDADDTFMDLKQGGY